eukprot:snap_masked-scaffold_27-processed-gene-1.37-mRNA-1 protein AED:1.00 eAED:1.00 QI:0/-1/0/0/-1/1/1/0/85
MEMISNKTPQLLPKAVNLLLHLSLFSSLCESSIDVSCSPDSILFGSDRLDEESSSFERDRFRAGCSILYEMKAPIATPPSTAAIV